MDDKIIERAFEGYAWSALRILRLIQMESVDDHDVNAANSRPFDVAGMLVGFNHDYCH